MVNVVWSANKPGLDRKKKLSFCTPLIPIDLYGKPITCEVGEPSELTVRLCD